MVYLIIGACRAGKSSIVTNTFVNESKIKEYRDLTWVTENDNYYILGRYLVEGRRKGTDLISRPEISLFFDQVINLNSLLPKKDIVLEGDKITSDVLFGKLKDSGIPCKLYWIQCSAETSIQRCEQANDTFKNSNLKAVCTKAKNRFEKWFDDFDGEIINTDGDIDFTKLRITL